MKRTTLVLAFVFLLTAGLCFAQDASSTQQPASQPSASQSATPQTDVGKPTDTDEQVFKGCVGGTKDNFTLTDETGKQFRLHSDKDITEHVGENVEVRGTIKKEGADSQATATKNMQQIDVADIKTVSKGCSAAK
jgi:hypothetical protein